MGSSSVDIDLKLDPSSAAKGAAQITADFKRMLTNIASGVEGADKKLQNYVQGLISGSTRAGRQIENTIKSMQRQAEMAGKSNIERLQVQQKYELERLKILGATTDQLNRMAAAQKKVFDEEQKAEQARKSGGGALENMLLRGMSRILPGGMGSMIGTPMLRQMMQQMGGGGGLFGGGAAGAEAGGGGIFGGGAMAVLTSAPAVIAGVTAALGGMTAASFAAANAVGSYAQSVHNMQIITGMSTREVQQFQIAARVTGQDVTVLQRMMRGLTQAVEDTGAQGQRAREVLQGMGVDMYSLQSGETTTMQLFEQVSSALEKQPNRWMRNKEVIDLFKRAGIDALPIITELRDVMQRTGGMDLMGKETIDQFAEVHKQLVLLGAEWDQFKLNVESFIAKPAILMLRVFTDDAQTPARHRFEDQFNVERAPGGGFRAVPVKPPSPLEEAMRPEFLQRLQLQQQRQGFLSQEERTNLDFAEQKLQSLKQTREELIKQPIWTDDTIGKIKETTAAIDAQKKVVEGLKQAETDTKAIEEALRRAREEAQLRTLNPFAVPAQAALDRALLIRGVLPGGHETTASRALRAAYAPMIAEDLQKQADRLQRQSQELAERMARESYRVEQGGIGGVSIRELGAVTRTGEVTRAQVEDDINRAYQQRVDNAQKLYQLDMKSINDRKVDAKDLENVQKKGLDAAEAWHKRNDELRAADLQKAKELADLEEKSDEQQYRRAVAIAKVHLEDQADAIKYEAQLEERRAQLRFKGDSPAAGIQAAYGIALDTAQKLYDNRVAMIDLEEKGWQNEHDHQLALLDLDKARYRAQEEAQLKLAEMQQQQLDTLKNKIEPLYQTLFTNPRKFGQQLRSTVQEAALHPIVSGLSEVTARALYPVIYGSTGTGGIAGAFGGLFGGGGGVNDLFKKPLPVVVVGGGGGGGGPIGTSIYSIGGYRGGGLTGFPGFGPGGTPGFVPGPIGVGGPVIGGPIYGGGAPGGGPDSGWGYSPLGPYSPAPWAGGGGGTDGSSGFGAGASPGAESMARAQAGPGGIFRGILGVAQSILSGSGGGKTGTGSYGSIFGGETIGAGGVWGKLGVERNVETGKISGVGGLGGAALMMGGMTLAQRGLLGPDMGTGAGVFEGAAGGAMIGMKFGGPIGAAIGAAAGLGAGIGEMLAGVETQRNEAKRLVNQIYHIAINNSTADQIVSIANQSYAGHVSLAVRAPEVRHMLGLYAAGTGQSTLFPQSADTPHGASLVESGGRLYQQATYQYGQAYTYNSTLPVYGPSGGNLPAPGGNVSLSLNIGGQDAAKFLQGNVVSPDVVQTQYASAMQGSSGRVPQALMMSEPGSIAG